MALFLQIDRSKPYIPDTVNADTIAKVVDLANRKGINVSNSSLLPERYNPSFYNNEKKFDTVEDVITYLEALEDSTTPIKPQSEEGSFSFSKLLGNLLWGSFELDDQTFLKNFKEFTVIKVNWYGRRQTRQLRFDFDRSTITRLYSGTIRAVYKFQDLKSYVPTPSSYYLEIVFQANNQSPFYEYYYCTPEDFSVILSILENILNPSTTEKVNIEENENQETKSVKEEIVEQVLSILEETEEEDPLLGKQTANYYSVKNESSNWSSPDSTGDQLLITPYNPNKFFEPQYKNNSKNSYDDYALYGYPDNKYQTPKSDIDSILTANKSYKENVQIKGVKYQVSQTSLIDYNSIIFKTKIAEGGFGEVHLGVWNGLNVAVKRVKIEIDNDQGKLDFIQEMLLMNQLRHPNISQFLGVTLNPEICIITNFYSKGSLYDLLEKHRKQKTTLPIEVKLRIALDIARGMCYLHSKNVVHRDLKSMNILIGEDLRAHITDFGLSKVLESGMALATRCGTEFWMAPEVKARQYYTESCDVYSYAILLWELFSNTSIRSLDKKQIDLRDPDARPPSFPCHHLIEALMVECWDPHPDYRAKFIDIIEYWEKSIETILAETKEEKEVAVVIPPPPSVEDKTALFRKAVESDVIDVIEAMLIDLSFRYKYDMSASLTDESYSVWAEFSTVLFPYFVSLIKSKRQNAAEIIYRILSIGYVDVEFEGKRLIHHCTLENDPNSLDFILSNKTVDISVYSVDKSNHSKSALHYAVENGYLDCTRVLINHGAIIDQADDLGVLPLHIAVDNSDFQFVKLLLANEGNPNLPRPHPNPEFRSLLCFAASKVAVTEVNDINFFITISLLKNGAQIPLLPKHSTLPVIVKAANYILTDDHSVIPTLRTYLQFILLLDPSYSPPPISSLRSSYASYKSSNNNNNVEKFDQSESSFLKTTMYENLEVKSSIVTMKVYPGKYLELKRSGEEYILAIESSNMGDTSTWLFEQTSTPNLVKIRSLFNDTFLVAVDKNSISITSDIENLGTNWKLLSSGQKNEYALKSTFGTFISAKDNSLSLVNNVPKVYETFFVESL